MKKFMSSILLLAQLTFWDSSAWAVGPKGKMASQQHIHRAQQRLSRMRVKFESPHLDGNLRMFTPAQLNRLAISLHRRLPMRTRKATTTGVSQTERGQLIVTHSNPNSPLPALRNAVDIARIRLDLPDIIIAPNPVNAHAEGAGEFYAEAHGLIIVSQGASRPACLDCQMRQDSQGILRAPGFTTGLHSPKWASPDLDPVRAQAEMAKRDASLGRI